MKINLRFLKKKTGKNKGFALIELICAVALFAVVLTPIFMSMVSSMRVNNKSRKLLLATEVAEDVMESVRDKTYAEVLTTFNDMKTMDSVYGTDSLVLFDGKTYSISANVVSITDPSSISVTAYADCATLEAAQVADYTAMCRNKMLFGGDPALKKTYIYIDSNELATADSGERLSFFALTNVKRQQYSFDVMVVFTPAIQDKIHTSSAGDYRYFSYQAKVFVYDADVNDAAYAGRFTGSPVAVMTAGIRNK